MAVDIKQLRIGSHVLLTRENKRVRIEGITKQKIGYHRRFDKTDQLAYARLNEIEPIAIMPELLAELGFVKRNRYDNNKAYYIDAASAEQVEKTRLVIPQIELLDYSEIGNPELWEVKILSTDKGFTVEHKTTVCFLHNLEAFIFLTLGKELIEE